MGTELNGWRLKDALRYNPRDSENVALFRSEGLCLKGGIMRRFRLLCVLVAAFAVAVVGVGTAVGADVTSNAGTVSEVFTRTTDTPFTLSAFTGVNFPVPFDVKHTSTLIISVSLRGVANSEREWGVNCSGSTVTCEPFAGVEFFHPGRRNTLSFTVVARDVPKGPGTVNLFIFAECALACAGTEELTVETLAAVVEAAKQ